MRKVLLEPQAELDLLEIWHYIAADSISTAVRVEREIEDEIRMLAEMPGKGHFRRDVKDQRYRFWSVYSYIIAYRYDDSTLTIVRIIHGRRNFRTLFPQQ